MAATSRTSSTCIKKHHNKGQKRPTTSSEDVAVPNVMLSDGSVIVADQEPDDVPDRVPRPQHRRRARRLGKYPSSPIPSRNPPPGVQQENPFPPGL